MFSSDESQAVLLVDATNAFNSLNRQVALKNIEKICPPISTILTNTYRDDIHLFIDGETLLSQEGTTQGDPLAMAMYALAITPLIDRLYDETTKQIWFADDASAVGDLSSLNSWRKRLQSIGPEYGYHPNASKSWLIVKQEQAKSLFNDTGVSITTEGQRYLGAALGSSSFVESYVQNKINGWIQEINQLSVIALMLLTLHSPMVFPINGLSFLEPSPTSIRCLHLSKRPFTKSSYQPLQARTSLIT